MVDRYTYYKNKSLKAGDRDINIKLRSNIKMRRLENIFKSSNKRIRTLDKKIENLPDIFSSYKELYIKRKEDEIKRFNNRADKIFNKD